MAEVKAGDTVAKKKRKRKGGRPKGAATRLPNAEDLLMIKKYFQSRTRVDAKGNRKKLKQAPIPETIKQYALREFSTSKNPIQAFTGTNVKSLVRDLLSVFANRYSAEFDKDGS